MRKARTVLSFILIALLFAQSKQAAAPRTLVIIHVTIIDVTGAPAKPDMTIVIAGDRIAELGKTEEIALPPDAKVVDGTGKFLIPGLWDMHVHTLRESRVALFFPVFIANGVLSVRDMGSPPGELDRIKEWKQETAQGIFLGPRIIAAGPVIDGPQPMFPELSIAVADEDEGRKAVETLKQRGADFLKVYSLLPRTTYFAIADEAKRQGIPFAGHVPDSVNAGEASDAGQKSIEHLSGILLACSTEEAELRNKLLEARAKSDPSLIYHALRLIQTRGNQTYDDEKADALFARFARNETWQVPTLVITRAVVLPNDRNVVLEPQFKHAATAGNQQAVDLIAQMRRAGVKFMAGTDAPNPWAAPGTSLHQELALFVAAGFTPLEALEAATVNPAKYLGLLDSLGTVEKGKIADLVVLDANPLEDIRNTRRISAVVVRGKMINKSQLQNMLMSFEVAACSK